MTRNQRERAAQMLRAQARHYTRKSRTSKSTVTARQHVRDAVRCEESAETVLRTDSPGDFPRGPGRTPWWNAATMLSRSKRLWERETNACWKAQDRDGAIEARIWAQDGPRLYVAFRSWIAAEIERSPLSAFPTEDDAASLRAEADAKAKDSHGFFD